MAINTYLAITTLNINELNAPIRMDAWIKKKKEPAICCLQEINLREKDTHRLKEKGWKKIIQERGNYKKLGVKILISDKKD